MKGIGSASPRYSDLVYVIILIVFLVYMLTILVLFYCSVAEL